MCNTNRGKFIVFEGIDGSGKTTQLKILAKYMKAYLTKEPTSYEIGSLIHKYLTMELHADNKVIAALFAADRLDHILNSQYGIMNMIDSGINVLSDRYYFSSYAYHSVDMDMSWVIELNRKSSEIMKPDLNIFIDITPETAMKRIKLRGETELYENFERLKKVRCNYYEAFERLQQSENVIIIDGDESEEAVALSVLKAVKTIGLDF